MKNPAASWRGIKELEESKLLKIFFRVTLTLDITFLQFPVSPFPHCRHIIAIWPKFSSPQVPLDGRSSSEDFSGRQTLKHLHKPPGRDFGMGTAEYMNVILVCAKSFHFNGIPFFNTCGSLFDYVGHFLIQESFAVLDRKDKMVMDLPRAVGTLLYFIFLLRIHSSGAYQRKRTP